MNDIEFIHLKYQSSKYLKSHQKIEKGYIMTKTNKVLLGLGALSIATSSIIPIISCSNSNSKGESIISKIESISITSTNVEIEHKESELDGTKYKELKNIQVGTKYKLESLINWKNESIDSKDLTYEWTSSSFVGLVQSDDKKSVEFVVQKPGTFYIQLCITDKAGNSIYDIATLTIMK